MVVLVMVEDCDVGDDWDAAADDDCWESADRDRDLEAGVAEGKSFARGVS